VCSCFTTNCLLQWLRPSSKLTREPFKLGEKVLPDLLGSPAVVYGAEDLTSENSTAFTSWFKALFDKSSEGIEDSILRQVALTTFGSLPLTLFRH